MPRRPTEAGDRRREAIVAFMQSYQREHWKPATLAEIAAGVGLKGIGFTVSWHMPKLIAERRVIRAGLGEYYSQYIAPPSGVPYGAASCEIDQIRGRYIFWME